ncbi:hypothetical protein [[Kitasatospora] papulosa]|uniref:hypothetical protein n=1 Tax=[Kitasatospora] papulosa TaxID=1464011 RepID=UPI002E3085DC|nr:hypothetical protein [[Kitasatospora] papulosa]
MIDSQPVIKAVTCVLLASSGRKLPERKAVGEVTPDELATVAEALRGLTQEVADLSRRVDALIKTTVDRPLPQAEQRAAQDP